MYMSEIEDLPELLGVTEVGKELGWDRRKVSVYHKRGKLPEPATYIGNRPVWTKQQITEYKRRINK